MERHSFTALQLRQVLIKVIFLCSLLLTFAASAQVTVNLTGASSAPVNAIETYNVSVTGGTHDASTYTVIGGTKEEETLLYVKVKWTSAGSRSVSVNAGVVYNGYNWYPKTKAVTVYAPLAGGSISASTATLICLGDNPGMVNSTSAASGGLGALTYQWEISVETGRGNPSNPSNWLNVSGATSETYNPPLQANGGDMYRRKVTASGESAYSNSVTYTIAGQVYAGSINYSGGNINPGVTPEITSSTDASGGIDPTYQWEQKVGTATSYSEISGETNKYYSPGPASVTTSYRRKTVDCTTEITSPVTINVNFDDGSISGSQTLCPNENPTPFTSTADPSGGLGSYDYRWYKSELGSHSGDKVNGNWGPWTEVTISLSNKTYDPPVLNVETRYKREVTSGTLVEESAFVYIFFKEISSGGTLTAPASPINPGASHANISGTSVSYATYQWQEKIGTAVDFTNIGGATDQNLTGRMLDFTTSYQRLATVCNFPTLTSNVVTVNVTLDPGSVGYDQNICNGDDPEAFISLTTASGGLGTYFYVWKKSEFLPPSPPDKPTDYWSDWVDATGLATDVTYDPPTVAFRTKYKRMVYSSTLEEETAELTISLNIAPEAPATPILTESCGSTDVTRSSPLPGVTWYWQTALDGKSTSDSTETITMPASGTAYLRARDNTTECWSATTTLTVSVEQFVPPAGLTAGSDLIVFVDEDFDLDSTGESPSGGTWSGPSVSGGNIFNASATGQYTVTYTFNAGGFCNYTTTKSIDVRGTPELSALGTIELYHGATVDLLLPDVADYSYQWVKDGDPIEGETGLILQVSSMGNYHAVATSTSNATTTTAIIFVDEPLLSQNQNFVRTRTMRVASTDVGELSKERLRESYTYFDGLGRQSQSIQSNASVAGYDIVLPMEYDDFGRQVKEYLPYVSSNVYGLFQDNALIDNDYPNSDHHSYYSTISSRAFTEKTLEPSPLSRLLFQSPPGEEWQVKGVDYTYHLNTSSEVIQFDWNQFLTQATVFYATNELIKNSVTDEDDKVTIEFTNKAGQVLLKQSTVDENITAKTYYIYDDLGQLKVVLPPEAVSRLGNEFFDVTKTPTDRQDFLNVWAFQYAYDARKRMVSKKVPGSKEVLMVYDQWDRLVLTQDGNQRTTNQWLFTKYDELNRPIITGIMTGTGSIRDDVMNHAIRYDSLDPAQIATHQYSNSTYPSGSSGLITAYLTVTYYDTYTFVAGSSLNGTIYVRPSELNFDNAYHILPEYNANVKGQVTGTMTKILGTTDFIESISYYDDRYRVIQIVTENHQNGTDIISNQYDFIGNVKMIKSVHSGLSQTSTILEYEYDHANRLMDGYHTFNDGNRIHIFSNEYNELGELIRKNLHESGTDFAQSVDYAYNIRGWLRSINESGLSGSGQVPEPSDLFNMELIYNTTLSGVSGN